LLENSEPATRDEIIKMLKSYGDELYLEIANKNYATAAADAEINPCEPPLVWNPITERCE
jgi:hypothetical protein